MSKRKAITDEELSATLKRGSGKGGWAHSAIELAKRFNNKPPRYNMIRAQAAKKGGTVSKKYTKAVKSRNTTERETLKLTIKPGLYEFLKNQPGGIGEVVSFLHDKLNEQYGYVEKAEEALENLTETVLKAVKEGKPINKKVYTDMLEGILNAKPTSTLNVKVGQTLPQSNLQD